MKQTLRERLTQELQSLITQRNQLKIFAGEYLDECSFDQAYSTMAKAEILSMVIIRLENVLEEH